MWGEIGFFGKVLAIFTILFGICYMVLTIPYWVAISDSVSGNKTASDGVSIALWILSALVLFIVGFCGVFGSCRESEKCLHMFAVINIVLWILGMIQLALYYITLQRCGEKVRLWEGSWFDSICEAKVNDLWLWIPNLITQFINACAACTAIGMKKKIENKKPADSKGQSNWFPS
eukprot:TRINITY_DN2704_c0_g1_i1.p1 TRINITY_DN2704_c0_g1~~TRINITY_DN2704_c0_g1_i1.p1  ORF type:complete len:175 (+),score=23.90 TRINITY_DN2704_c0_g1_i1:40-564(+)